MEIASYPTDVYGPRLTNSPGFRKPGEWAVTQSTGWGLANARPEPWGPFGRGWSNDRFPATVTTAGGSFPLIVAAFVYHAANRDEKLPRKPLPKAQAPPRAVTAVSGR